ncbi:hypothetical protein E3N88_03378 [Mikania micrantha]|uniref:Uncharacterized protein n=1 Tax=Mikania micrantha TaxID=192012 RepID=A0A5N6Q6J9_9ASTR|nr:hypothetical protein E3N88_03378 [Mikania micrantha]
MPLIAQNLTHKIKYGKIETLTEFNHMFLGIWLSSCRPKPYHSSQFSQFVILNDFPIDASSAHTAYVITDYGPIDCFILSSSFITHVFYHLILWMDAHENLRPPSNVAENNDGSHGLDRHDGSKSSRGLSTSIHAVHGVGFVAKKAISNRLTESLWHSRSRSSSASVPSDSSDIYDTKKENHSHESADHHTLQSSLNVADQQTPNDIDQFEN